jgi:cobalamin biosynthesis Mg chelatase CobN
VLALLALACFPVFAHAEDSSGIQYETASPTVTGKPIPQSTKKQSHPESGKAGSSSVEENTGSSDSGVAGGSSSDESTGGSNGGSGQPSQGNGSGNAQSQAGKAQPASGKVADASSLNAAEPASKSSDGGGSSPLVPILIAVVVLAAISVGVFVIRQKRQGSGPAVTPKAG